MRVWHALVLWFLLTALLRLVVGDAGVWTAAEVDTLEAGVVLAEHLTDEEAGLRERLAAGFTADPELPRAAVLPEGHPWRRAVVEPPLPKWLAAASIMLSPTSADTPNLSRAATGAAALLALAAVLLLAGLWSRDRLVAVVAAGGLLLQPGALAAAGSAGYGAAAALSMALLLLATLRLCEHERVGGLAVGASWGLTLGVHPGAAFLVIVVFVAFAIARRGAARCGPDEPGMLALPVAPVSLFAAPVVGLIVLVALWPALWNDTGRRLGAWLMDTWWMFNPGYDIGGVVFEQANDRAAMAWTALAQWAGWHAVPLTVAFVAGAWRVIRRGREGLWFPLLAWLTLVLVGAGDGGLFGGRLSLMPLLWVPGAVVVALGVRELADAAARRLPGREGLALPGVIALVIAPTLIAALAGAPLAPTRATGGTLRAPAPTALLQHIAREQPEARVHVTPRPEQWRPAIDAARDHLELPLAWAPTPGVADWVVYVGGASIASAPDRPRAPRWQGTVGGVRIEARGPQDSTGDAVPRRDKMPETP